VQGDGRIFGGATAREARGDRGWRQHGIETVPPIVGRCVVVDVAGRKGVGALPDGYEITVADLEAAVAAELRVGDVVLVRTGKIRDFYTRADTYFDESPGIGRAAALWLHEQGMAVLGTDTAGTEPMPFADPARTLHRAMLVEHGVHLIENVFLDDLAADGVADALFVCLPLKLTGATGSWVRPIAIA
jgi:kynurenine formamidase